MAQIQKDSALHATLLLNLNCPQEPRKGGFSKGGSVASSVAPKRTKIPKDIGPSRTSGTQSATAKRGALCKTPLLITPLSLFLIS